MPWQHSIQAAVKALRKEETQLERQLAQVQHKIKELGDLARSGGVSGAKSGSRRLSAKGRAAISKAAKKRWAKYRSDRGKETRSGRRAG